MAASPAIWWDDRSVLADEPALARRLAGGGLHVRVLITSAEGEQHGSGGKYHAIDDASGLAARLAAMAPGSLEAGYFNFAAESHVSVSLASLGRAINFALKP